MNSPQTTDDLTFEQEISLAARRSIVKAINSGEWLKPDYQQRVSWPAALAQKAYASIDYDEVMRHLKPKINEMVADRIAAALSQELTNDVKRVLSHEPTRLRLRLAVMNALGSTDL